MCISHELIMCAQLIKSVHYMTCYIVSIVECMISIHDTAHCTIRPGHRPRHECTESIAKSNILVIKLCCLRLKCTIHVFSCVYDRPSTRTMFAGIEVCLCYRKTLMESICWVWLTSG